MYFNLTVSPRLWILNLELAFPTNNSIERDSVVEFQLTDPRRETEEKTFSKNISICFLALFKPAVC